MKLSVVVPVYNEEESIQSFFQELMIHLPELASSYEVIFVDDGSTDTSLELLQKLDKENKHVKVYSFRKNNGKAEALHFGFQKAGGDLIATLDADLQDQPKEIKKLLEKYNEGVDVVCGWRKDRKDKSKMKFISKIFNFFVHKAFEINVHDYNCGLKLYSSDAAKSIRLYGGLHRFIPVLVKEQGFSVDEVAVEHQPRKFGTSKYGFSKIFKDLPDMFTMLFLVKYRQKPLHFFGLIGGLSLLGGFFILTYLTFIKLSGESIGGRPLLFLGVLLFVVGVQIFLTGFLAELILSVSQKEKTLPKLRYSTEK